MFIIHYFNDFFDSGLLDCICRIFTYKIHQKYCGFIYCTDISKREKWFK